MKTRVWYFVEYVTSRLICGIATSSCMSADCSDLLPVLTANGISYPMIVARMKICERLLRLLPWGRLPQQRGRLLILSFGTAMLLQAFPLCVWQRFCSDVRLVARTQLCLMSTGKARHHNAVAEFSRVMFQFWCTRVDRHSSRYLRHGQSPFQRSVVCTCAHLFICMSRFQNVLPRCPTPRFHCISFEMTHVYWKNWSRPVSLCVLHNFIYKYWYIIY
jgi:hypothetical protein